MGCAQLWKHYCQNRYNGAYDGVICLDLVVDFALIWLIGEYRFYENTVRKELKLGAHPIQCCSTGEYCRPV